jgi:hypothetical protein
LTRDFAGLVILAGVFLIVLGILFYFGALGWFGKLPGDIRFERGGTRVFFPLTSMIVISVGLSLVLSLLRRLF